MDAGSEAELRTLRERAYGPDADIAGDPTAVARLRELQEPAPPGDAVLRGTRPRGEAHASGRSDDSPTAVSIGDAEGDPSTAGAGALTARDPAAGGSSEASVRPRSALRLVALWGATLVVTALVAAWVATAIVPPVTSAPGARHVMTLRVDESVDVPWHLTGSNATDFRGFEEYFGLTPIVFVTDATSAGSQTCMTVAPTEDLRADDGFSGVFISGCSLSPYPVNVSMKVGTGTPVPMLHAFAAGTTLQFVLDGDVLQVFAADPSAATFEIDCPTCQSRTG